MTTVVLHLRDEELLAGRMVGRIEVIRGGGAPGEAGTIRDLADLAAILLSGERGLAVPTGFEPVPPP